MSKDNSQNNQGYCYEQGYDAGSGNYDPSAGETIAQGFDALACKFTGKIGEYQQGYVDGYNQTNPNAGISGKKGK